MTAWLGKASGWRQTSMQKDMKNHWICVCYPASRKILSSIKENVGAKTNIKPKTLSQLASNHHIPCSTQKSALKLQIHKACLKIWYPIRCSIIVILTIQWDKRYIISHVHFLIHFSVEIPHKCISLVASTSIFPWFPGPHRKSQAIYPSCANTSRLRMPSWANLGRPKVEAKTCSFCEAPQLVSYPLVI